MVKNLGRFITTLAAGALLTSCLSLTGQLEVVSSESYRLSLSYSVREDFARIKYLANNGSVMVLPLTAGEYAEFEAAHPGVVFSADGFSRIEREGRILIESQILFDNPADLGDLLSCRVLLEGDNPFSLTLSFDRGGEPSQEAVTYINGYCAGEVLSLTMTGPGGSAAVGEWPLRELLLDPQAPAITLEWEE